MNRFGWNEKLLACNNCIQNFSVYEYVLNVPYKALNTEMRRTFVKFLFNVFTHKIRFMCNHHS